MTHVQLYLRHLHYNELSKATGQVKKILQESNSGQSPFKGNFGQESTFASLHHYFLLVPRVCI